MLCKTECSWENYGHDHTRWICLIFYNLLPTTSGENEKGQQMTTQILTLGFKGLTKWKKLELKLIKIDFNLNKTHIKSNKSS